MMKAVLDTSVIVAALDEADPDHAACRRVLLRGRPGAWSHALSETFSTLTGGRLGFRVSGNETASLLRDFVAPGLALISLTDAELLDACAESEKRGVRGGAIDDFLHLVAARKVGAEQFHTLNLGDFEAMHRAGDPEIVRA
jgi:predicted nucleic acid-binding protein